MYKNTIKNKKSRFFLGLMQKFRSTDTTILTTNTTNVYSIHFKTFKKYYISLLNIVYIFEFINQTKLVKNSEYTNKIIYFYAKLSGLKKHDLKYKLTSNLFPTYINNNIIVFSKPNKQLFLIIFRNKPIFIFTGGLMRIVMNEKRKSSKKLYKVATSLIKLLTILMVKQNYFDSCYLKLNNVGNLRSKILNTLFKSKLYSVINYIIYNLNLDKSSQKFKTRRSIKKYVKKRFKLNT